MEGETKKVQVVLNSACALEGADASLLPATFRALETDLKLSPKDLSVISFCQTVSSSLVGPFWGYLTDVTEAKGLILLIGCFMWGVLTLFMSLTNGFTSLAILRFFNGIALSTINPVSQTILSRIVPKERYGSTFGWVYLSIGCGTFIGTILCTSLSEVKIFGYSGWRCVFFGVGVLCMLYCFVLHAQLVAKPLPIFASLEYEGGYTHDLHREKKEGGFSRVVSSPPSSSSISPPLLPSHPPLGVKTSSLHRGGGVFLEGGGSRQASHYSDRDKTKGGKYPPSTPPQPHFRTPLIREGYSQPPTTYRALTSNNIDAITSVSSSPVLAFARDSRPNLHENQSFNRLEDSLKTHGLARRNWIVEGEGNENERSMSQSDDNSKGLSEIPMILPPPILQGGGGGDSDFHKLAGFGGGGGGEPLKRVPSSVRSSFTDTIGGLRIGMGMDDGGSRVGEVLMSQRGSAYRLGRFRSLEGKIKFRTAMREIFYTFKKCFAIPTFCIIVLQGIFGNCPANALSFLTMFFQYCGYPNWIASILSSCFLLGCIPGCLLGGIVGDRLNKLSRKHGRAFTAQLSVLSGIPLLLFVFQGISKNPSIFSGFLNGFFLFVFGLVSSWCSPGVNRPLLLEIVERRRQGQVLAWLTAIEGSSAALLGAPVVGFLAETVFGYTPSYTSIADMPADIRIKNMKGLSSALTVATVVPYAGCLCLYSLLHLTVPRDIESAAFHSAREFECMGSHESTSDLSVHTELVYP